MTLYHFVFKHGLTHTDPEFAHHATVNALRLASAVPGGRFFIRALFGDHRAGLEKEVMGLKFPTPFGLAAGFDKDGEVPLALIDMGYGYVEVGTVTARPQMGNDRPRCFRLVEDRSLINRMGFNNQGAERLMQRLRKVRATKMGNRAIIGVNIGKTKITPLAGAEEDYRTSASLLAPYASYLAINVSSPNTPELRKLQAVDALRPIVQAVQEEAAKVKGPHGVRVPVLVKIDPDQNDDQVRAICALVKELNLDGVIAVNTTVTRPKDLLTDPAYVEKCGPGGLSGPCLLAKDLHAVRLLRAELGEEKTIIGVGGINTAEDAQAVLDAGADLIQGYTAMIYDGPGYPQQINKGLRR